MLKNNEEVIEMLKEQIEIEKDEIAAKELALYYLLKELEKLEEE